MILTILIYNPSLIYIYRIFTSLYKYGGCGSITPLNLINSLNQGFDRGHSLYQKLWTLIIGKNTVWGQQSVIDLTKICVSSYLSTSKTLLYIIDAFNFTGPNFSTLLGVQWESTLLLQFKFSFWKLKMKWNGK